MADRLERRRIMAGNVFRRDVSFQKCFEILTDRKNGKYVRALALATLFFKCFPATRKFFVTQFGTQYDFSRIPINPDLYKLHEKRTGLGYWSEVFFLEPRKEGLPPMALKVEFPKTSVPVDRLVDIAKQYRSQYEFLRDAFSELADLIPNTMYLVMYSPRTGNPAVAALQEFIMGETFDPLSLKNEERFRLLLKTDSSLREEFQKCRDVTLSLPAHKGPDLAGHGNLLVLKTDGGHTLRFVDPHGFSSEASSPGRALELQRERIRSF